MKASRFPALLSSVVRSPARPFPGAGASQTLDGTHKRAELGRRRGRGEGERSGGEPQMLQDGGAVARRTTTATPRQVPSALAGAHGIAAKAVRSSAPSDRMRGRARRAGALRAADHRLAPTRVSRAITPVGGDAPHVPPIRPFADSGSKDPGRRHAPGRQRRQVLAEQRGSSQEASRRTRIPRALRLPLDEARRFVQG